MRHMWMLQLVVTLLAVCGGQAAPQRGGEGEGAVQYERRGEVEAPRLLPHLVPRYRPVPAWDLDYDLDANTLNEQDPESSSEERYKRGGPSLSIVNPLDVLRQRLLLEMARRHMRESSRQVAENRKLMSTIGKRGTFLRQPSEQLHRNAIGYDTM